jgi:hypothetical protein
MNPGSASYLHQLHTQATDIMSQGRFCKPNLPVPSLLLKGTFGHPLETPTIPQRCPSHDGEDNVLLQLPLHIGHGAMVDPGIPQQHTNYPTLGLLCCSKLTSSREAICIQHRDSCL